MDYENQTERMLLSYLEDLNALDFSLEQAMSLLDELAYPDPSIDWAAGQACAICPPAEVRRDFYEYIRDEIRDLYCNHHDSAIPIAEYIVDEIKINTKSKYADEIRSQLTMYSNKTDHPNAFVMGNSGAVLGGEIAALLLFANIVRPTQPWDHKGDIVKKFEGQGVARPVKNNGDPTSSLSITHYTKYKDYDYFYDVWSNIHYGYVGRSIGFSESTLTLGSNIQQIYEDFKSLSFNSGDTRSDKAAILIGIELYNKFGKYAENLTAQDVLDALDENKELHDFLDRESKQTHWCWHSKNEKSKKKRGK